MATPSTSQPKADREPSPATTAVPAAWSAAYREDDDKFDDFATFEPAAEPLTPGTPVRQLSSRQMSGQFEEETAKAWEEDWDDEDVDDTFDRTMERIARNK